MFAHLVRRDLARAYAGGGMLLPLVFFLLVATLLPFAIGSDAALLARTGGGILWTAALLAALIPVERLFGPDIAAGTIDQMTIRGIGEEAIAAARIVAHWLGFGPPLMLAAVPAAAVLGIDRPNLILLEASLALGTPGLAALGVGVGALTGALRGVGALAGLLMLPLAVPLLIFGAGAMAGGHGALQLLAATSLALLAAAPFAAGAALRAARG